MGLATVDPLASLLGAAELAVCFWVVLGSLFSVERLLEVKTLLPVSSDLPPPTFTLLPCADSLVVVVSRDCVVWACSGLAVKWDVRGLPNALAEVVELVKPVREDL